MIKKIIKFIVIQLFPYVKQYIRFTKTGQIATYSEFLKFKMGFSEFPYPVEKGCQVGNFKNIKIGINCLVTRPGNYIQGKGKVEIGDYVQFGPNVGILSSNHDLYDQNKSIDEPIFIGKYSWVGMNSVITAGVKLGTRTIVGAGSVVTKSFPEGFCVIAGNPAKIIKHLDKDKFVAWHFEEEFYGFVPKEKYVDA